MNLPNKLTILRIILAFIFVFFILMNGLAAKLIALIVFAIAAITDYYDGYYAKKYNLISDFGKLMDPIADKILMLTAFFIFTRLELVEMWMFAVIFIREVAVTILRLFALKRGKVMAAQSLGKYKTVSQIVAVSVILIFIVLKESSLSLKWSGEIFNMWFSTINILMIVAAGLTLVSGLQYIFNFIKKD